MNPAEQPVLPQVTIFNVLKPEGTYMYVYSYLFHNTDGWIFPWESLHWEWKESSKICLKNDSVKIKPSWA